MSQTSTNQSSPKNRDLRGQETLSLVFQEYPKYSDRDAMTQVSSDSIENVQPARFQLPNSLIVEINMNSHFLLITSLQLSTKLLTAAFGKPTYPVNPHIAKAMLRYWNEVQKSEKAIGYGQPQGRFQYRDVVAEALSKEYKIVNKFQPEDVVFTVGGIGGIHAIFHAINNLYPDGKIVTPLPYYPYYTRYKNSKNSDPNSNSLHFIDLFKSGNLTLNAEAVKESMTTITANEIGAFLFCDPCNPSGTTPSQEEWKQIALILLEYPDVPIILDEAYREMVYDKENLSLISVAPELLDRIVLIRSATKGLSAAGERMAVVVTKNKEIIRKLTDYINIAHLNTPLSAQYAYSEALFNTNSEYSEMANFYQKRVNFMKIKIEEMDAQPKQLIYNPGSSFYLLADLSKLRGKRLNIDAKARLIDNKNGRINTDFEVVYHLLYKYNLALCPLSFFGAEPQRIMVRITCSESFIDLEIIHQILKSELEETISDNESTIQDQTIIEERLKEIQKKAIADFSNLQE